MTGESTEWQEILDDFEDLLEQTSHAAEVDDWEHREFAWEPTAIPSTPPTPTQQERLAALLLEGASAQAHIQDLQQGIRTELSEGRLTQTAAQAYLRSTP
jgi:hypothetical protein